MESIHLFLIKLFFGKFSFNYQSRVQILGKYRVLRKKFHQPCTKQNLMSHFFTPYKKKEQVPAYNCSEGIIFNNIPFGISFRQLKKTKRKYSCYDIEKHNNTYWQIIGYKERIFNTGVKTLFHFLDNKFFFGEYFFSDQRGLQIETIAKTLLKKYTNISDEVPSGNFIIKNENNEYIFFEDNGISLSIKYINGKDQEINALLDQIFNSGIISETKLEKTLEDIL